jgi:hypothetical protein
MTAGHGEALLNMNLPPPPPRMYDGRTWRGPAEAEASLEARVAGRHEHQRPLVRSLREKKQAAPTLSTYAVSFTRARMNYLNPKP